MFCRCGSVEPDGTEFCSRCGEPLFGAPGVADYRPKRPWKTALGWSAAFTVGFGVGFAILYLLRGGKEEPTEPTWSIEAQELQTEEQETKQQGAQQ